MIHTSKGDEIWLVSLAISMDFANILLNTNNKEISYADLSISQKIVTYLNKPRKPCKTYEEDPNGIVTYLIKVVLS